MSDARGSTEFSGPDHIIDCDAYPVVPYGLMVEDHRKAGQFKWNPADVTLYLSDRQRSGSTIMGSELRAELRGKPVCNANVLDYLLANVHLIPDSWKGKYIFFWGTIYRRADGHLHVRRLFWAEGKWYSGADWLGHRWNDNNPAAMLAT